MMYDIIVLLVIVVVAMSLLIKWHKEDDDILPIEPEDYKNPFTQYKNEDDESSEEKNVAPEIKTAEEYRSIDKNRMTDEQIKERIDEYVSFLSSRGSTYASYTNTEHTESKCFYHYIIDNKEELKSKGFTIKFSEATRFSPASVALVWDDTSSDGIFNMLFTEEL